MCYTTESYEDDISVLRQINPNIIALDEKTLEAERRSYHTFFDVHVVETCQTAFKRDPRSASKRDPLFG